MAVTQVSRQRVQCGHKTLHAKYYTGAGIWLLLCVFTAGLALPVWLLYGIVLAFRPFHCQTCGAGRLT